MAADQRTEFVDRNKFKRKLIFITSSGVGDVITKVNCLINKQSNCQQNAIVTFVRTNGVVPPDLKYDELLKNTEI